MPRQLIEQSVSIHFHLGDAGAWGALATLSPTRKDALRGARRRLWAALEQAESDGALHTANPSGRETQQPFFVLEENCLVLRDVNERAALGLLFTAQSPFSVQMLANIREVCESHAARIGEETGEPLTYAGAFLHTVYRTQEDEALVIDNTHSSQAQ